MDSISKKGFVFNKSGLKKFLNIFGKENEASMQYLKKVYKYEWLFSLTPFLEEVFVCNTVAFGTADKKSDIDLFVITKNNKIWTCRVILSLLTHILGIRRHGNKVNGRFCLSFWATEKGARTLEDIQIDKFNDPYLAAWTATLIPILNSGYYEEFKTHNKWIENYGLTWDGNLITTSKNSISKKANNKGLIIKRSLELILKPAFIENILKTLFIKRSLNKKDRLKDSSGIIITDDILKFHDKDIRGNIAKQLTCSIS